MWKRITRILVLLFFLSSASYAQETWSLEKCVQYAQQNNLSVRQAQNTIRNAELLVKQSQLNRLPNLSGSIGGGLQFGRTIDPVTNDFKTEQIGFNSYSINGGVMLFGGNQINNSIKQSQVDLEAAKLDATAASNDIALNVALAYLNILLSQEELENAQKQLELSQEQLEQTDKLIQAGSLPKNDRLDFIAQIALNEQTIIVAENSVASNYLLLKQLLELDPNQDIAIERPEILIPVDVDPDDFRLNDVFMQALNALPDVEASELRIKSAELQVAINKAFVLPTVSVGGGLSTNYSSVARQVDAFETVRQSQTVFIDNSPVNFEVETLQPTGFSKTSFGDQFKDNFGQNVGFSISIPIYSNSRNRINIERARLGVLNAEVANRQVRQTLSSNIQRAIADSQASKRSLEASHKSVEAASQAFDNAQKRFDLGSINSLEYVTARNNLDRAETDLIRARYQYLFNLKVVEFYQGKPLRL